MRARRSKGWALWVALACLCASTVQAQQSVVVLGFMSEDGDDTIAAELTSALREQAGQEAQWSVAPSGPSLSQLSMAFDCDYHKARCLRRMTANLGMDLVVHGTLERGDAGVSVRAALFDVYQTRELASASATLTPEPSAADYRYAAAVLVAGLLGREPPVAPEQAAGDEGDAQPLAPAAALTHDTAADAERSEPTAGGGGGHPLRWVGYGLLGVAGISVAMTIVSWAQIGNAIEDESYRAYRVAVGDSGASVSDVCDEAETGNAYGLSSSEFAAAKDACAKGSTYQVLQYVFLGTALAAGTAGAIILLTEGGSEQAGGQAARAERPRLSLHPSVGMGNASLAARLRF